MPDLLVNLLKLEALAPKTLELEESGVVIRRANPFEITTVLEFVEQEFSIAWADEISVGFANKPVSVFIAIVGKGVVGFSAYECTRRGFLAQRASAKLCKVAAWERDSCSQAYGACVTSGMYTESSAEPDRWIFIRKLWARL